MIKVNKTSNEIALQIREQEKDYERLLKDSIKTLQITGKEYNQEFFILTTKRDGTVKRIIEKLGSALAKGLLKERQNKISAKLKRDLDGVISRSSIHEYLEENHSDWIAPNKPNPKGKNQYTTGNKAASSLKSGTVTEPMTPKDVRYIEAHKHETIRNALIDQIVQEWTGVNKNQIPEIFSRTSQGKHWAQTLLSESTNHMKDICYKMTMSALHGTLEDLRILEILGSGFSDIALEVYEQRKKTESLESV